MYDNNEKKCLDYVSNLTRLDRKNCEFFGGKDGAGELFNLRNGFNRINLTSTYFIPKHALIYIEQDYDGLVVLFGQHERQLPRSDIYLFTDQSGQVMTSLKTRLYNWKVNIEPRIMSLSEFLKMKKTTTTASYFDQQQQHTTTPTTTVTVTSWRTTATTAMIGQIEIFPQYKQSVHGKFILLNSEIVVDSMINGFEVYMIEPGPIEIGVRLDLKKKILFSFFFLYIFS